MLASCLLKQYTSCREGDLKEGMEGRKEGDGGKEESGEEEKQIYICNKKKRRNCELIGHFIVVVFSRSFVTRSRQYNNRNAVS